MELFIYVLIFIVYVIHWRLSIWAQSIFLHRIAAHGMYTFTEKSWEKAAYWFSLFVLGPSYLSPRAYTVLHRMHHAYSDTERDPHKPYAGFFGVFKTLHKTARRYAQIFRKEDVITIDGRRVLIEDKYKTNLNTDWEWFDQTFHNWKTRITFVIIYIMIYGGLIVAFDLNPLILGMVLLHSIMGPLHGAIVNYYAHKYGERSYETNDTSRNLSSVARFFLGLQGELLHNNHHKYPSRPDFSGGTGEDGSYKVMRFLEEEEILEAT